jgi:hypothetical protein
MVVIADVSFCVDKEYSFTPFKDGELYEPLNEMVQVFSGKI